GSACFTATGTAFASRATATGGRSRASRFRERRLIKGEDEARGEPKRILIVDDEDLARRRVARYLAKYVAEARIDCRIAEAGTGLEAVEMIESFRPEIIFLDIEMPGL